MGPSPSAIGYIGAMAGLFALGIPLVALVLWLAKVMTPFKVNYALGNNMLLPWLVCVGLFVAALLSTMRSYRAQSSVTTKSTFNLDSDRPLELSFHEEGYENYMNWIQFADLSRYEGKMYSDDVDVDFVASDDDQIHVLVVSTSRGRNNGVAQNNAELIKPNINYADNSLKIPTIFHIKNASGYRNQSIRYEIAIPNGTRVDWNGKSHISYSSFEKGTKWRRARNARTATMNAEGKLELGPKYPQK